MTPDQALQLWQFFLLSVDKGRQTEAEAVADHISRLQGVEVSHLKDYQQAINYVLGLKAGKFVKPVSECNL